MVMAAPPSDAINTSGPRLSDRRIRPCADLPGSRIHATAPIFAEPPFVAHSLFIIGHVLPEVASFGGLLHFWVWPLATSSRRLSRPLLGGSADPAAALAARLVRYRRRQRWYPVDFSITIR